MVKKPKIKKPEPKILYIDYTETREGGDELNDDQYSEHSPCQVSVKFNFLCREQSTRKMFYHSVEVDNDTFNASVGFLAVVRYSTGDTFGSTDGMWEVIGCAPSHKIAEVMLKQALEAPGHKTWEGYFESLEDTEIHCLYISD